MPVLQGNTSGSIAGIPYNIPSKIISFTLTNMTGGSISATVAISSNSTGISVIIAPLTIAVGDTYVNDAPIVMLSGYTILLVTSGSLDYYFSIE